MGPRGSMTSAFAGFRGSDDSDGVLGPRRGFERHPSMHIAAQIASATTLTLAPPSPAAAAAVAGSGTSGGMAPIKEGPEDQGVNGIGVGSGSKSVTIKEEGE